MAQWAHPLESSVRRSACALIPVELERRGWAFFPVKPVPGVHPGLRSLVCFWRHFKASRVMHLGVVVRNDREHVRLRHLSPYWPWNSKHGPWRFTELPHFLLHEWECYLILSTRR